jgi:hypothetical protein
MGPRFIFEGEGFQVKIIIDNISKNSMPDGIAVSVRDRVEFRAIGQWTAWRLIFQPQRMPHVGCFVRLSTRTLKKYRYKGPAIVEIMPNPDGPALGRSPEGGYPGAPRRFARHHWVKQQSPISLIVEDKYYRNSQRACEQTHVSRSERYPRPTDAKTGGATASGLDRDAAGLRQRWSARLHQYGAWCKEKADGVRPNRH